MSFWKLLMSNMAAAYDAAGRPGRVLAAVSGGADSMALLEILSALQRGEAGGEGEKRNRFFLAVCHVNHGLRPEAETEAALVEERCKALGIPCQVRRVQVILPGEDGARQARYEALLDVSREMRMDAIALAHHQNDQAETLLLHLFRGGGEKGLAAMRPCAFREGEAGRRVLLWRPLLDAPPDALREILRERQVAWAEDPSNQDATYLRNFLRRDILPRLTERLPEAPRNICRAAQILGDEDECLTAMAEAFLREHGETRPPCRYLETAPLTAQHAAMQRRILRAFCPFPLDFVTTERLRRIEPGSFVNLPKGWRAQSSRTRLHLLPPVPEKGVLGKLETLPYQGAPGDGIRCQAMPKALYAAAAPVLRFRQPGDRIFPLGGPGEKSLQDYLTDRGIDRPFRDYIPLLCIDNRVLWAIGVGPGEEARVRPGAEAVLLHYQGELPGKGKLRDGQGRRAD